MRYTVPHAERLVYVFFFSALISKARIPGDVRGLITANKRSWEKYNEVEFFSIDLDPKIRVHRIYEGHWSWCDKLALSKKANDIY